MNNKIESVIYIRSANNSKRGLNLQRLECETYAKQNSMSLSVIEDSQASGFSKMTDRPGLRLLIHLVEVGLIKNVIVSCLSRISRDVKELHYIQSLFKKHNAKIIVTDKSELSSK